MTTNDQPPFNLEQRTFLFAKRVQSFLKRVPRNAFNFEYQSQLIRSSASTGANYIEANESLGRGDFLMKIKTCKRESKESAHWLGLLDLSGHEELEAEREALRDESRQLMLIFGATLRNTKITHQRTK